MPWIRDRKTIKRNTSARGVRANRAAKRIARDSGNNGIKTGKCPFRLSWTEYEFANPSFRFRSTAFKRGFGGGEVFQRRKIELHATRSVTRPIRRFSFCPSKRLQFTIGKTIDFRTGFRAGKYSVQ